VKCYFVLYPANLFNVNFEYEDLPATLEMADPQGSTIVYRTFTKLNPPIVVSGSSGTTTLYYREPGFINFDGAEEFGAIHVSSGQWVEVTYVGPSEFGEGPFWLPESNSGYASNNLCFQLGPDPDGNDVWLFDPFADTLTVTDSDNDSVAVSRGEREEYPTSATPAPLVLPFSECGFENFVTNIGKYTGSGTLLFYDFVFSPDEQEIPVVISNSCKWTIQTSAGTFQKIGTQNTPVGNYAGGFTVS
jgi:hypothetical protein